jgi:hypothetical protein
MKDYSADRLWEEYVSTNDRKLELESMPRDSPESVNIEYGKVRKKWNEIRKIFETVHSTDLETLVKRYEACSKRYECVYLSMGGAKHTDYTYISDDCENKIQYVAYSFGISEEDIVSIERC